MRFLAVAFVVLGLGTVGCGDYARYETDRASVEFPRGWGPERVESLQSGWDKSVIVQPRSARSEWAPPLVQLSFLATDRRQYRAQIAKVRNDPQPVSVFDAAIEGASETYAFRADTAYVVDALSEDGKTRVFLHVDLKGTDDLDAERIVDSLRIKAH